MNYNITISKEKIENLNLYMITHNIENEQFKTFIKNIFINNNLSDKIIETLGNQIYKEIAYGNDIYNNFNTTINKILNNQIDNSLKEKLLDYFKEYDNFYPNKNMLIDEKDFIKSFLNNLNKNIKILTPIKIGTKLILIKNINLLKNNLKKQDNLKELKNINLNSGNSLFIGHLWEQLNLTNSLIPSGYKRIINHNEWNDYIKNIFPNNNNYYKDFDLHIIKDNRNIFIELKNYYQENHLIILNFSKNKNYIKKKLENNIQFSNDNKSKVYYYIHNTKTNVELLIPVKDLYNLLLKHKFYISFDILIEYLKKNYPENYKNKTISKINNNIDDFFNDAINLFQKNITETELLIQLNNPIKDDFLKNYDNFILSKINNRDELFYLFLDKNLPYTNNKKLLTTYFNNFIYHDLDFDNKEMLNLCFNNLKNALNSILKLKNREKISLDKTNIEKYYRSKKVIETINKYGYSMNIIFDKSYKTFLKTLVKDFTEKDLKKIIKNKNSDYYRRIKPFLKKTINNDRII